MTKKPMLISVLRYWAFLILSSKRVRSNFKRKHEKISILLLSFYVPYNTQTKPKLLKPYPIQSYYNQYIARLQRR